MSRQFPQALFALIFAIFIVTHASATTYYIAANGSDSNNGTSTSTPWLHAPGMPNCSSTCNATTIDPGDSIIFRGGDTWHFQNPSPSSGVYTGGKWTWRSYGTTANCQLNPDAGAIVKTSCVYIGTSSSYYSGASFTRPVFTQDNPISNSQPASCPYGSDNFTAVDLGTSAVGLIFDDIEMSGACWQTSASGKWVSISGNQVEVSNLYVHGWELGSTSGSVDVYWALQGALANASYMRCDHNVFDNTDGTFGTSSYIATGSAINNTCHEIDHNVFNQISNVAITNWVTVHDNALTHIYNNYTQSGQHMNLVETNSPQAALGNLYIYNNLIHDFNVNGMWPEPYEANLYQFNNVIFNNVGGASCWLIDGQGSGGTPVQVFTYNNTFDSSCSIRFFAGHGGQEFNGTASFVNNHYIGFQSSTCTAACTSALSLTYIRDSSAALTVVNNGSHIFQSTATANGQGYTTSNNYAPTSSGGATVGAGANNSSFCSGLSSSTAAAACANGTSSACSEVSGEGGSVVSCPAIAVNARGSTWNVAAYQFDSSSSGQPSPPTGLSAQVQ